jgi:hypothetical protein
MIKISFLLLFSIHIILLTGQEFKLSAGSGNKPDQDLSIYNNSVYNSQDSVTKYFINGQVLNIFNEPVDSVKVITSLDEFRDSVYSNYDGLYKINLPTFEKPRGRAMNLEFHKNDYKSFDTVFFYVPKKDFGPIKVKLIPKYKILLKGRIFVANMPLEDVNVTVIHNESIDKVRTLSCYYDKENYWNCLYLGMFKSEIVTENPEDTVYLKFSKDGYRSQEYKLKFSDYSGELIRYRMFYADTVPYLPDNNIGLKIAWPVTSSADWYLGLSFYRLLGIGKFERLAVGADISMVTSGQIIEYETLPGIEKDYDSTYITGFAGPSALLFLTKPYLRRFSTYIGCTFALAFNNGEISYQPFTGTRFFLDMNKSINVELRYLSYNFDIKRYRFNYLGQAESYYANKLDERLILNFGLQINF